MLTKSNCSIVRRINFDQQLLSRDNDTLQYKNRIEKYRFNDLKLDFYTLQVTEQTLKKSPIIRFEVALKDNYGLVYETVYKTITDNQQQFHSTYESLIHPMESLDTRLTGEGFFVRIPTKSLDTLKKIYLLFMVQTLVYSKDAKGNKIKSSNFQTDMDSLSKL